MKIQLMNGATLWADLSGASVESMPRSPSCARIHTKTGHTFDVQATPDEALTWVREDERSVQNLNGKRIQKG